MTHTLLRGNGPLLRIGHRGAAALAPANTMDAVEAALALGVDMVELDVLWGPNRTLVLGHSHRELKAEPATLDDVFAFLAEQSPETGLLIDVKGGGLEGELVEALRRHDLVLRTVAATNNLGTLQALRRLEPGLARSRTYPPGRLYVGGRRTFVPVVGPVRLGLRLALPYRIEAIAGEGEVSATTLDRRLVTRAAVERCHSLGVAVLVWTVNDRAALRRLDRLGVDGIITDDPRIFAG
ncbi:MAG TPA: glycerophosphodiester phosphodiesterase [Gaiellaceae bacterium]|nr:glycerophosphodiester phosphodiesterase [Gaiellaceae bacterium]